MPGTNSYEIPWLDPRSSPADVFVLFFNCTPTSIQRSSYWTPSLSTPLKTPQTELLLSVFHHFTRHCLGTAHVRQYHLVKLAAIFWHDSQVVYAHLTLNLALDLIPTSIATGAPSKPRSTFLQTEGGFIVSDAASPFISSSCDNQIMMCLWSRCLKATPKHMSRGVRTAPRLACER